MPENGETMPERLRALYREVDELSRQFLEANTREAELREKAFGIPYAKKAGEDSQAHIRAHKEYIQALEERGRLFHEFGEACRRLADAMRPPPPFA